MPYEFKIIPKINSIDRSSNNTSECLPKTKTFNFKHSPEAERLNPEIPVYTKWNPSHLKRDETVEESLVHQLCDGATASEDSGRAAGNTPDTWSTGYQDDGARHSVRRTQIGRKTRPKPKSGRRTSGGGNRRGNTSMKTSNVDVDYSKSRQNLKWPVTSVTISSLSASTEHVLLRRQPN